MSVSKISPSNVAYSQGKTTPIIDIMPSQALDEITNFPEDLMSSHAVIQRHRRGYRALLYMVTGLTVAQYVTARDLSGLRLARTLNIRSYYHYYYGNVAVR